MAAKTKKPRTRRVRQDYLPGTAPEKNARVHPLALNYADLRDERIAANKLEKEAHDTLLHTMLEEGLEVYEYGDLKVVVNAKRKCRVETKVHKLEESNGEES